MKKIDKKRLSKRVPLIHCRSLKCSRKILNFYATLASQRVVGLFSLSGNEIRQIKITEEDLP